MVKKICLLFVLALVVFCLWLGYRQWSHSVAVDDAGLFEVANGDAQFWLMQGAPNNRFMPCSVYYYFDRPLDDELVLNRLKDLVASYSMFQRNVVEVDGLPYWQFVEPDWDRNFRVLDAGDDIEAIRAQADEQLSRRQQPGEGLPLFRAYLSADRRQLVFMWHHVISDFEGMFNTHACHLFLESGERTQFGCQINRASESERVKTPSSSSLGVGSLDTNRPLGFSATGFDVQKIVLPIEDKTLHDLGQQAGLAMSDLFSLLRCVPSPATTASAVVKRKSFAQC